MRTGTLKILPILLLLANVSFAQLPKLSENLYDNCHCFKGYGEKIGEEIVSHFRTGTGLELYVMTAHWHTPAQLWIFADRWGQHGKGILIAIDPVNRQGAGEPNWSGRLRLRAGPELKDRFPDHALRKIVDEVGVPALNHTGYFGTDKAYRAIRAVERELVELYRNGPGEESSIDLPVARFKGSPDQRYGFDGKREGGYSTDYEQAPILGQSYTVPWKSVATGMTDEVDVEILLGNGPVDESWLKSLSFRGQGGRLSTTTVDGRTTLRVQATMHGEVQPVEVHYEYSDGTGELLGKLNVVGYNPQEKKVTVVPVNNTKCPFTAQELQRELNRVFGQAATAWQVTIERDLTVEDIRNRPFKNKGTELLSNYTDDMLSVIRAYKRTAQMADNTFYLFLVSNPEDPDRVGYFPLKRNAGFVFADRIPDMIGIYKTIAHELAHGAFRLQHPWEDRGASKTTQYFNLMDYTREGVHLHKYQWDLIHDPVQMLAVLQREEEGEYATIKSGGLFSSLANKDGSLTFHNPAGRLVTIPSHAKDIIFSTYDVFFIRNTNVPTEVNGAIGSLLAFTIGDTQFKASGDNLRNKFAGYFNGNIGYLDTLSFKNNVSKGIVLITGVESKNFKGYAVKLAPENNLVEKTSYGEARFSNDLFIIKLQPEDLAKNINRFLADSRAEEKVVIDNIQVLFQNKFSMVEIDKEIFSTEDFLKNSLHEGSSIADILAHFILAYQAPNVISSFSSCLGHNINEAMNRIVFEFKTRHLSGELISIDYSLGESLSVKFQNTALHSIEELNAANQLRAELLASKNITDVYEAIKKNHSTCTFMALYLSDREMILKWLLSNDNSYWTIHGFDIIEELLNNAPKDQIVPLLELFMQNDYGWLYTIYNNSPSNNYKANVIYLIVQKVAENYSSLSISNNSFQDVFFDGFNEYSSFKIPVSARPFFIPLNRGTNVSPIKEFELIVGENNETGRIEFTKDGYLRFVQTYSYKDTRFYYQNADSPIPRLKSFESVDFKLTPFETVLLLLMDSYPELGFEANQVIEVPAILAPFILNDVKSEELIRKYRNIGNAVAALVATFTVKRPVSVGIFLTRLSGTVAVIDSEIQIYKEKHPSSYQVNKELYEAWEQIYISVAFADGIYGIHSLIKAINITSLAKNIDNYSALLKNGKNYPDIFADALSSLKRLSPQGVFKNIATGAGNFAGFPKIKMKISTIDPDGWLMGKYVNGELQVVGNTNVAQKWDYIVKSNGEILVGRKHSWLSQGEEVLAAGELKFTNGKLVEINNASGHYLPTTVEGSNFLRVFREAGVKVDDATLTIIKEDGTIFKQIYPSSGDRAFYY